MITCRFENGNEARLRHVVVDILIVQGDKILLIKRAKDLTDGGKWALPGGFMDRDETLTQTAEREAFEETGYRVKNLKLFKVSDDPNRPGDDRQTIPFFYSAEPGEQEGGFDHEVSEIKWFALGDLPPQEQIAFDHYKFISDYSRT